MSGSLAHEVFVSYSRSDGDWVREELLPTLAQLGVISFIDDGRLRETGRTQLLSGLKIGDNLETALGDAICSAQFVLLILTPDYFSSQWCRWELERIQAHARKLEAATSILQLRLRDAESREVDLPGEFAKTLAIDLTDVASRPTNLAVLMDSIRPGHRLRNITLGSSSLKHLMKDRRIDETLDPFKEFQGEFKAKISLLLALKEVHDAIQVAQDAWNILSDSPSTEESPGLGCIAHRAQDLKDKCEMARLHAESPLLESPRLSQLADWRNHLREEIEALDSLTTMSGGGGDRITRDELRHTVLENTKGLLFLSTIPTRLNGWMAGTLQEIPMKDLRGALELLRELAKLPWAADVEGDFRQLVDGIAELEDQLSKVDALLQVHDRLQAIEDALATAGRIEASFRDIERSWIAIVPKWDEIHLFSDRVSSFTRLDAFVQKVAELLQNNAGRGEPPRKEIKDFQRGFHQSFSRTDVDLKNATQSVQLRSSRIEGFLSVLGTTARS